MTETTFEQANPAFAHTEAPETEVVEEFGNPEPVAEIVIEPDPEPNPADAPEEPTLLKAGFDPVGDLVAEGMSQEDAIQQIADENGLELADDEEEEPPAAEE